MRLLAPELGVEVISLRRRSLAVHSLSSFNLSILFSANILEMSQALEAILLLHNLQDLI